MSGGSVDIVADLSSLQEEADERILFHMNHAYHLGYKRIVVWSPDTDVFVCILSHLHKHWTSGLQIGCHIKLTK